MLRIDNRKFVRFVESENDLIQFSKYLKGLFNKHIDVKTHYSPYRMFPNKVVGYIETERYVRHEYSDYREVIYIISYEEYVKIMNGGRLL